MKWKGEELQDCEFELKVTAMKKRRNIEDIDPHAENKKVTHQRDMVFLIPKKCDETTMFLRAWYPETREEHFEVAMFLKGPIFSPCRGAVMRANEICGEPHIVVMSKGLEEEIVSRINAGTLSPRKEISCTIFPQNEESMADGMRESSGDYDVV